MEKDLDFPTFSFESFPVEIICLIFQYVEIYVLKLKLVNKNFNNIINSNLFYIIFPNIKRNITLSSVDDTKSFYKMVKQVPRSTVFGYLIDNSRDCIIKSMTPYRLNFASRFFNILEYFLNDQIDYNNINILFIQNTNIEYNHTNISEMFKNIDKYKVVIPVKYFHEFDNIKLDHLPIQLLRPLTTEEIRSYDKKHIYFCELDNDNLFLKSSINSNYSNKRNIIYTIRDQDIF